MKIQKLHLMHLRNEAHYEFMLLYKDLVNAFAAVKTIILTQFNAFITVLTEEGSLVDAQKGSTFTAEIAVADDRNDRLVTGIKDIIAGSMRHFDQKVVKAAIALHDRLKAFGRIESKSYEEQAAALHILVNDLLGKFSADAATVGISSWVTELAVALADFERLLKQRNDETASRLPHRTLKEIRHDIDEIYHQMIARIDAAAMLDDEDTYTLFIQQLNAEIIYFNEHTHHHARKDIKTAEVDQIPVQQFTDKEVTPIPTVHLANKELTFARDFFVSYKNNIQPGTATLIIHGKGRYKGQKIISFNIFEETEDKE
jgi:hypothetical protein